MGAAAGPAGRIDRRVHEAGLDDSGEFELHQDHVDQRLHGRTAGLDHEMAAFAVQRVALGEQLAQPPQRVGHLQQRPVRVVSQAAMQFFGCRPQIDHGASVMQRVTIGLAQADTATGGQKPAKMETGAVVRVPLFINEGEVLKIDTRTGEYISRAK